MSYFFVCKSCIHVWSNIAELDKRATFTVQCYQEVQSDTTIPGSSSSEEEEDEVERTTSVYFQTSKKGERYCVGTKISLNEIYLIRTKA